MSAAIPHSSYTHQTQSAAGFTLIELMVTIAAPNISAQLANQRVKATADILVSALEEAKVESVILCQPLMLSIDNDDKEINIQRIAVNNVESTLATYKYNLETIIKSNSNSIQFEPSKVANTTVYTIFDSNTAATSTKATVNATAVISVKSEGDCP